jgi:hypothetical protein
MKTTHVRIWKALATALVLFMLPFASASAFVDPPTFSPAQPYAGQPIEMSVRAGYCHGFFVPPEGYPFVEIQRYGNTIDVIITGSERTDPILCMIQPNTLTVNMGGFPAGSYVVRIRIRSISHPNLPVPPPISQASLVVRAPPPPAIVPAGTTISLLLLAGLILWSGFVRPND